MGNKARWILLAAAAAAVSCTNTMEDKALKKTDMDLTASPAVDFNQYANGGWMAQNPIPDDKASYNTFGELRDKNEAMVKAIVDELLANEYQEGTIERKIGDMFKAGMDSAALNQLGAAPLAPYFERIDAVASLPDLQRAATDLRAEGIATMFSFYGSIDDKNTTMNITQAHQGGYALRNRDYYFDTDARTQEIRGEYQKHIARQFANAGYGEAQAEEAAQAAFGVERGLAQAAYTNLELRDPVKNYNKMTVADFQKLMPSFDLGGMLAQLSLDGVGDIVVGNPAYFQNLDKMLRSVPLDAWKSYLKWIVVTRNAPYLSDAFVDEDFGFFGRTMSGAEKNRPRWKRVLGAVNSTLDEGVGQIYVKKYFGPEAKARMTELVANLKAAFAERIDQLEWMSDETKARAQEKLAAMKTKIGYPDKWKDYTTLRIDARDHFGNQVAARRWHFADMLSKIDKPVDKEEWEMSPQTVNAYYHPLNNEIAFPAAILQPPFFYAEADDAVNYGAIGVVIGHEMTHGFDDQGRMFDKDGNLQNWWTDDDKARFEARAQLLIDQFDEVVVLDSVRANGRYTLGENIADLGGLRISHAAFTRTQQHRDGTPVAGLTPDQRFYLSYAHVWAQNIRDKEKVRLTKEDVHSLGVNRVNQPLRLIEEFHAAFGVTQGDPMHMPLERRATIW